jgi:Domain of unknown function (DUF4194)
MSETVVEEHLPAEEQTVPEEQTPESDAGPADGFIDPVPMEEDPSELFAGDSGTLDAAVRRVLVRLLQRRFLVAERNRAQWRTLLENQQVRSAELDVPIMLKDDPYSRAETLVLVHLRTLFQREQGAGESSARVDVEEVEQTVLTFFDPDDKNLAARQTEIRNAVRRLEKEGLIEEESEGRFRVTPLVEIVLSNERLVELRAWLREQNRSERDQPTDPPADTGRQTDPDAPDTEDPR